jgi:hypothetical protein
MLIKLVCVLDQPCTFTVTAAADAHLLLRLLNTVMHILLLQLLLKHTLLLMHTFSVAMIAADAHKTTQTKH